MQHHLSVGRLGQPGQHLGFGTIHSGQGQEAAGCGGWLDVQGAVILYVKCPQVVATWRYHRHDTPPKLRMQAAWVSRACAILQGDEDALICTGIDRLRLQLMRMD